MDVFEQALGFYLFAAVALFSAIAIVITKSIVRAAVFLLGTLGGVACLYFVLSANFLAAIQLIVYAGGTLILIVFGVMLTSRSPFVVFTPSRAQVGIAVVIALLLAAGLCTLLVQADWASTATDQPITQSPQVKAVGESLLQQYLVPFEVASVLLLVVMIGAAYLARPEN